MTVKLLQMEPGGSRDSYQRRNCSFQSEKPKICFNLTEKSRLFYVFNIFSLFSVGLLYIRMNNECWNSF